MLDNERYIDQIDAYLKGELSPDDTSLFENEISKNPVLRKEVDLQKSIVEVIRSNRKAELKQRLNNIDIKSGSVSWWKYAAVASLVTTFGALTYFTRTEDVQKNDTTITSEVAPLNPITEDNTTLVAPTEKEVAIASEAKEKKVKPLSNENAVASTKTSKRSVKSKDNLPNLPKLEMEEGSAVHEPINKVLEAPKQSLTNTPHINATVSGVEVVKSKKHKFHYRYFDNKLYLYGNFDSKTYDILELNSSKGQALYLKYEGKYFNLEQNKTEISKLEIVKESQTLKELEEIQKK